MKEKLPTEIDESIQAIIERLRGTAQDLGNQAEESADETREEIAPGGKRIPEQMWAPCAPMPTDMCRVSPFHPMARQKVGERPFIKDMIITKSAWGQIKYTGPKLSTYEEDVLLAVLALLDQIQRREEGESAYTYRGPLLPIFRLMGYRVNPGEKDYKRVTSALELMHSAVVKLEVTRGKRKAKVIDMVNILSNAKWDEEKKELKVTVNPFFYENYIAGTVTLIDVLWRARLKSPIAKALHRFMQSHRGNHWKGHFLTLAAALNLDLNLPGFKLRDRIKVAIRELIEKGFLMPESSFPSKDVVELTRYPGTKVRRKMIK